MCVLRVYVCLCACVCLQVNNLFELKDAIIDNRNNSNLIDFKIHINKYFQLYNDY